MAAVGATPSQLFRAELREQKIPRNCAGKVPSAGRFRRAGEVFRGGGGGKEVVDGWDLWES